MYLGGGITISNGRVVGCDIKCQGRYNGYGAGILIEGKSTLFEAPNGLTLRRNEAQNFGGGGISVSGGAKARLRSVHFQNNFAETVGGALALRGRDTTVEISGNTIFDHNKAFRGGAVACLDGAHLRIGRNVEGKEGELQRTVFSFNSAYYDGGALFIDSSYVNIVNTVAIRNAVTDGGSFAHVRGGNAALHLTGIHEFFGNSAAYGGPLSVAAPPHNGSISIPPGFRVRK